MTLAIVKACGPRHAEERDGRDALREGAAQAVDRRRLVPGRLVIGLELELHGTKIHLFPHWRNV
jgi:hypothetical protein